MTELKPTEKNQDPKVKKTPPQLPKKDVIKQFQNLFESANKRINKEPSEKPTNKHNQNQPTVTEELKQQTLVLKDEKQLTSIFHEMGIQNIQQIEQIILNVTQKIQETTNIPHGALATAITIQTKDHQLKIKLSQPMTEPLEISLECDDELKQLLSKVLPDLKNHLNKQGINTKNIILIDSKG